MRKKYERAEMEIIMTDDEMGDILTKSPGGVEPGTDPWDCGGSEISLYTCSGSNGDDELDSLNV